MTQLQYPLPRLEAKVRHLLAFVFGFVASTSALACETDTGAVQLPGESRDAFENRDYEVRRDQSAADQADSERIAFAVAKVAYFAIVESNIDPIVSQTNKVVIIPKKAIKGLLPNAARTLLNPNLGGMCHTAGDGAGATARTGEIVLVFEGLTKSEIRPNGIESFRAMEIRTSALLEPLAVFVQELEAQDR